MKVEVAVLGSLTLRVRTASGRTATLNSNRLSSPRNHHKLVGELMQLSLYFLLLLLVLLLFGFVFGTGIVSCLNQVSRSASKHPARHFRVTE